MIPGSNLLADALQCLDAQPFQYEAWSGTTTNSIGNDVDTFSPPVTLQGMAQPVSQRTRESMGLDWKNMYFNLWTSQTLKGTERDRPGDRITWQGRKFDIVGVDPWSLIDGWNSVVMVDTGPA